MADPSVTRPTAADVLAKHLVLGVGRGLCTCGVEIFPSYGQPRIQDHQAAMLEAEVTGSGPLVILGDGTMGRAQQPDAESLARLFHENYLRLSDEHGWEPQDETVIGWELLPATNRALMIATAQAVIAAGSLWRIEGAS